MCGRFNLKTPAKEIAKILGFTTKISARPRYNIAPSQDILAARYDDEGKGEIVALKWGLIPSWVKDLKKAHKPINAKVETVAESPYFRVAIKKRRCLIPANGFYEWQPRGKVKQPYLIHRLDDAVFFFAGLWETWTSNDGEVVETTTILTTDANDLIAPLHNRMPVIMQKASYEPWLDRSNLDPKRVLALLSLYPSKLLEVFPVSTVVNSPKNDIPECIQPLA